MENPNANPRTSLLEGKPRSSMRRLMTVLVLIAFSLGLGTPLAAGEPRRAVDVVICLDTSGSMQNLLDSTRARIWDVVSEFSRMKPLPELRVGFLTYGTDQGTAEEGWILLGSDLSTDLDAVYAKLMAVEVGGGEELVGRALHFALEEMSWSKDWDALRMIFVAGNESADQGQEMFDVRDAAAQASAEQIFVNALYAGNREQGMVEAWPVIAQQGKGNFSAIDPELGTLQIATPQDELLRELNESLNSTYLPYGPRGQEGLANQAAQDRNASRLGVQSCSSRVVAKGGALYTNASWDLVDATLEDGFRWSLVHEEDLPQEMRTMNHEERVTYVEDKRAVREAIQEAIQEASAEREEFLRAALDRQRRGPGFDDAMLEAIRGQARAQGFDC